MGSFGNVALYSVGFFGAIRKRKRIVLMFNLTYNHGLPYNPKNQFKTFRTDIYLGFKTAVMSFVPGMAQFFTHQKKRKK